MVQQWMDLADKKLDGTDMKVYCSPGNDDMDEVDEIVRASRRVLLVEGQVTPLDDHHEMIASGWSNRTPWDTHREEDEDQLKVRYEAMISRLKDPRNAIFNIHVPPYKSNLDEAPELDKDLRPKDGRSGAQARRLHSFAQSHRRDPAFARLAWPHP